VPRLLVHHEVSNEQALVLALHEPVMALSGARGCAARSADCGVPLADQRRAAGALGLLEVEERAVAGVEVVVEVASRGLHVREDVEAPVYRVVLVHVVVGADVAHALVACQTHLQSLHVRVLLLVVDLACRDVRGH